MYTHASESLFTDPVDVREHAILWLLFDQTNRLPTAQDVARVHEHVRERARCERHMCAMTRLLRCIANRPLFP